MDLNTIAGVAMTVALGIAMVFIYRAKPGLRRRRERTFEEE